MTKPAPRTTAITPASKTVDQILGTVPLSPAAKGSAPPSPPKPHSAPGASALRPAYIPLAESVSPDKRAGYREILCWVFDNSGTAPEDIDHGKIPSRGAVKLLDFVHASVVNYTKFLDMHAKAVSDKGIAEAAAQAEYDERRQTKLLDGILDKYKTAFTTNTDGVRLDMGTPPRETISGS